MPRFLLLHAKSADDAAIGQMVSSAESMLSQFSHGQPFTVETGRDFFEARFKAAGSWEAWAEEAGAGVHPVTRAPTFDGYLVPSVHVGSGTARVVEAALRARRPIYLFRPDGAHAAVCGVMRHDSEDWKQGWTLLTGPLLEGGGPCAATS